MMSSLENYDFFSIIRHNLCCRQYLQWSNNSKPSSYVTMGMDRGIELKSHEMNDLVFYEYYLLNRNTHRHQKSRN